MDFKLSDEMQYALDEAKKIAIHYKYQTVGIEHVTLAIFKYPNYSTTMQIFDFFKIKVAAENSVNHCCKFTVFRSHCCRRAAVPARRYRSDMLSPSRS